MSFDEIRNEVLQPREARDEVRKAYATPHLIAHGTVERITEGASAGPADLAGQNS